MERLAVNKQGSHRFHMERFNLKKLNEVGGKEKYRVQVSNRFTVLEDIYTEVEINTGWETFRDNIKISVKENLGYYELKKHDERRSELLDQWKQTELQWLQDTNEINGDNLNSVRHEATSHFRSKNKEYLKN
jgi:hypothetical protein